MQFMVSRNLVKLGVLIHRTAKKKKKKKKNKTKKKKRAATAVAYILCLVR